MRVRRANAIATFALLAASAPCYAGMPSLTLTDVARLRVDSISFFLLLFFASAWAVQALWNYLGRSIAALPRMTYGRALAAVALWGFAFVLVLTMISGARELLTPGAWEKQGVTYKLRDAKEPS